MGKLQGRTQPRLWTPPQRPLTQKTTLGYDLAKFAGDIGCPLLPWQKWLAVHALELSREGRLRYRIVLVLVARQNGKSRFSQVTSLFKLYVMNVRLVLGVAQDQVIARENLNGCLDMIDDSPYLTPGLVQVFRGNGREEFRTEPIEWDDTDADESVTIPAGGRYKIAASNRKAGRGLSVDHLNIDEIGQWHAQAPWGALFPTISARPDGQVWAITNAGDGDAVVLNMLRDAALTGRDDSIGLFEWSAEDGCDLYDPKAWCQANPGLGHIMDERSVRTAISSCEPPQARAEILCQFVDSLNAAVSAAAWKGCTDPGASMEDLREIPVAACFDVSPDSQHCTLAVAGKTGDSRAKLVIARAWDDTDTARAELDGLLDRIRPAAVAWYPSGPGGSFATILRRRAGSTELKGTAVAEACQEFADLVAARRLIHPGDQLLDSQIRAASKLRAADGWRFTRASGHVDACYAAAGAVVTALAMPEPVKARIRVIS